MSKKLSAADIAFLREIAAQGGWSRSDNLPQTSYANVCARRRCKAKGLVTYKATAPRKGVWSLSDEGRATLNEHDARR